MGKTSSIKRLPPELRDACEAALQRGCSISEVAEMLNGMGADVSRSAVGRYAKGYRELVDQMRQISTLTPIIRDQTPEQELEETRVLAQIMRTYATQQMIDLIGSEEQTDGKSFSHMMAGSEKALKSAQQVLGHRRSLRDFQKLCAEAAESAGRTAGASEETINFIKAKILGLDV